MKKSWLIFAFLAVSCGGVVDSHTVPTNPKDLAEQLRNELDDMRTEVDKLKRTVNGLAVDSSSLSSDISDAQSQAKKVSTTLDDLDETGRGAADALTGSGCAAITVKSMRETTSSTTP